MLDLIKRNPRAFGMALAMHLVLVFFLIVGVDWLVPPKVHRPNVDVVQAKVIDAAKIDAEAKRLQKEQQQIKARKQSEKNKSERELVELKKKQEVEKRRLQDLENKSKTLEKQRIAAEKKRKLEEQQRKTEVEKQRQVEKEKQRQVEVERKRKEAEAKQREEARQKAEAEARNKAEAERKRQVEEDRNRREAELRSALEAEQNDRALNAFAIAVTERITQNWLRPSNSGVGLRCKLRVRLSSSGTVLGVQVAQSSGNGAFDRSAEAAVYKSDPLPAPPAGLQEINFFFDPDNQ